MAQLPTEDVGLKQKLDTLEDSLRLKYYDIIKSISADELKKFKLRKHQYKEMIMNIHVRSSAGGEISWYFRRSYGLTARDADPPFFLKNRFFFCNFWYTWYILGHCGPL